MVLELALITLAGFLGSYHCIGMCGAIPSLIQYRSWFVGNILYSTGRIFSYTFLGFVAGYLGSFFNMIEFQSLQKVLSIFVGIMMIFFGLQITGNIKEKGIIGLDYIFTTIADLLSNFRKNPFLLGMFNGFLPCPLVYAFLFKAVDTKSSFEGALVMLAFGLGTVPAMLFASKIMNILTGAKRKILNMLAGLIVILFGVFIILKTIGVINLHHHHHHMEHMKHQQQHHNGNNMNMDNKM